MKNPFSTPDKIRRLHCARHAGRIIGAIDLDYRPVSVVVGQCPNVKADLVTVTDVTLAGRPSLTKFEAGHIEFCAILMCSRENGRVLTPKDFSVGQRVFIERAQRAIDNYGRTAAMRLTERLTLFRMPGLHPLIDGALIEGEPVNGRQ